MIRAGNVTVVNTFARQLSRTFFGSFQLRTTVLDSPSHDAEANAFSGLPIALLILSQASLMPESGETTTSQW